MPICFNGAQGFVIPNLQSKETRFMPGFFCVWCFVDKRGKSIAAVSGGLMGMLLKGIVLKLILYFLYRGESSCQRLNTVAVEFAAA